MSRLYHHPHKHEPKTDYISSLYRREVVHGEQPYKHEYNKMVQTILIPRDRFSLPEAYRWIEEHGYTKDYYGKGVDVTTHFFRFRQKKPNHNADYYTETLPNGIEIVIYKL